jgi:hypothetical protein
MRGERFVFSHRSIEREGGRERDERKETVSYYLECHRPSLGRERREEKEEEM